MDGNAHEFTIYRVHQRLDVQDAFGKTSPMGPDNSDANSTQRHDKGHRRDARQFAVTVVRMIRRTKRKGNYGKAELSAATNAIFRGKTSKHGLRSMVRDCMRYTETEN